MLIKLAQYLTNRTRQTAILGLGSFEKVLETFKSAKHHLGEILSAFEVFDKRSLEIVLKHTPGSRHPLGDSTPFYILIESAGSCKEHDDEKLTTFLESVMESGLVTDGVVAQDGSQAATFWALRESISDSCAAEGGKYKYDVSVPLTSFYPLVEEVSEFLVSKGLYDPTDPGKGAIRHVIGFGHMGDGNVHLNVLGNGKRSTETEKTLNDFVFRAVSRRDGSISAEHGIGLQKAHALSYSKSSDAIDLMRVFKATLDPRGILNPYKTILPSKEKT